LSWKIGHSEEDPKAVAIELLRKSYDRGALEFDLIADDGPFQISIKDFVPQETKTSSTLTRPKASKEASALGRAMRMNRAGHSSPPMGREDREILFKKLGWVLINPPDGKK